MASVLKTDKMRLNPGRSEKFHGKGHPKSSKIHFADIPFWLGNYKRNCSDLLGATGQKGIEAFGGKKAN